VPDAAEIGYVRVVASALIVLPFRFSPRRVVMIHTQSAVTRGVVAVATSAMLRGVSTAVIGCAGAVSLGLTGGGIVGSAAAAPGLRQPTSPPPRHSVFRNMSITFNDIIEGKDSKVLGILNSMKKTAAGESLFAPAAVVRILSTLRFYSSLI